MNSREEERILYALATMCVEYVGGCRDGQYLPLDPGYIGAGDGAVNFLKDYGLVEPNGRGGTWTERALALLAGRFAEVSPKQVIFQNEREEERALYTLASMCGQYIGDYTDGLYLSPYNPRTEAAERAISVLADYGFLEPNEGGGTWTKRGLALLRMAY